MGSPGFSPVVLLLTFHKDQRWAHEHREEPSPGLQDVAFLPSAQGALLILLPADLSSSHQTSTCGIMFPL